MHLAHGIDVSVFPAQARVEGEGREVAHIDQLRFGLPGRGLRDKDRIPAFGEAQRPEGAASARVPGPPTNPGRTTSASPRRCPMLATSHAALARP